MLLVSHSLAVFKASFTFERGILQVSNQEALLIWRVTHASLPSIGKSSKDGLEHSTLQIFYRWILHLSVVVENTQCKKQGKNQNTRTKTKTKKTRRDRKINHSSLRKSRFISSAPLAVSLTSLILARPLSAIRAIVWAMWAVQASGKYKLRS